MFEHTRIEAGGKLVRRIAVDVDGKWKAESIDGKIAHGETLEETLIDLAGMVGTVEGGGS